MSMRKRALMLALTGTLASASFTSLAQAAPAPLCRDAKQAAVKFSRHLINAWSIGPGTEARGLRYHSCHRWQGSQERLWFSFSAHDPLLGRVSWWVRATWHDTFWHYYTQGLGVVLTPEMLDVM